MGESGLIVPLLYLACQQRNRRVRPLTPLRLLRLRDSVSIDSYQPAGIAKPGRYLRQTFRAQ